MIECSEVSTLEHMYVDSELPEEVRTRIERHLFVCQKCAFEIRAIEQTKSMLLESFGTMETSASYRDRALAKLHNELQEVLSPTLPSSENQWSLPYLREASG
jgi:anti-sigma factor RsiW